MQLAIFTIFSIMCIAGAILVITLRSPVSSAIALVFVMCTIAGLFALIGGLFVAAIQVIVYAGAVMVLFLFVIMLLNIKDELIQRDEKKLTRILGGVLGAAFLLEIGFFVRKGLTSGSPGLFMPAPNEFSSIESISTSIFTKYLFAFEVTSILLLVAIVGAIMLARGKGRTET
ncbi:MAG: NADH-quinone oxidoreductase subunit J [candidate division Zixibacteria bacterium]|nr:NADH-quinone oxidoreductase subunit J [candidate division Zixibacteria bacterium]